jgi:N-acyl-L-homoserine lactone synthetase
MYVIRASNDLLRDQVYRIRYQVYCSELGYEFEQEDGREIDVYDRRSVHLLVMESNDRSIGTCRMILPEKGVSLRSPLPTECVLDLRIWKAIASHESINTDNMGEISRMAILREFRSKLEVHRIIARALVNISVEYNLDGAIGLLFPAFIRHWRRFNVNFRPIGGLIEHHGVRQPCYILTKDAVADLAQSQAA